MSTVIVPTLNSTVGYVADIRDQIATLVRFIILNPGWTSSMWETDLVSFRSIVAGYQNDREELANQMKMRMKRLLDNMYNDYNVTLELTTRDATEGVSNGNYAVVFSIWLTKVNPGENDPEVGLISGSLTVDPTNNALTVNYINTPDNLISQ